MVKVEQKEDPSTELGTSKELYVCEKCGFHYAGKEWAEKCEAWCKEHPSCNLEIIQYAEEGKHE
jgi:rubrerythrin